MNASERQALHDAARWLATHTRFPAVRLDPHAEKLVCMAALAAREPAPARAQPWQDFRGGAQRSAQRQHALRRSRVHFKCDNSAKV